MVTYCWAVGLPGPTFTLPNESELGLIVARGWTPAPDTATVCGEPGASSGIERVPLTGPVAVGAKASGSVQVAGGAAAACRQPSVAIVLGLAVACGWSPVPDRATVCGEI